MALELRCVFITLGRPTVRTRRTTSSPASSASRPSRPAAETPILPSFTVLARRDPGVFGARARGVIFNLAARETLHAVLF